MTSDGLCSYCDFYRRLPLNILDTERHRSLFERRLERIRGKYPYDALVGISGGKDGAYVLHRLVKDYGLRVLAFTFDNGFLSEEACGNIRHLVDIYRVDHLFYRPMHLLPLYRSIVRKAAVPCHACAMGGYYRALALLIEQKIPLFVHGRSPAQMFRNLDRNTFEQDPYFSLIRSNFEEYDPSGLQRGYRRLLEGVQKGLGELDLEPTDRQSIDHEFFAPLGRIEADFVPESFAFFLTERYDEDRIRTVLREQAGYVAPTSHSDCLVHNAANYLSAAQYSVSVAVMETASRVRLGELDPSVVEHLAETDHPDRLRRLPVVEQELTYLCNRLGLCRTDIARWQNAEP